MPNPPDVVSWSLPAFVLLTDFPWKPPFAWDRLFGSFAREQERSVVGLTANITIYNPPRVATS
ncbi:hypothetical protein [Streptomyces sp. NBC_00690]|uniref:hypothetical protein n=1 Tax=Streptomyces sp. NBC_00690 TaxID=2975808 RepID=UPI003FA7B87E